MYTFCCLIWKRDFSASYTCFVVEMALLVLARRRRKFFERTLDFLHSPPRAKNNLVFFGGVKMVPYVHIFDFLGVKMLPYIHIFYTARRRRKNSGFLDVKMLPYIHILDDVFVSKCYHMYIFWGVFGVKNAAIYTHFWNLIFPKKRKKKKNNRGMVVILKETLWCQNSK